MPVRKGSGWLCVVEGSVETPTILINCCICKAVQKTVAYIVTDERYIRNKDMLKTEASTPQIHPVFK